MTEKVHTQIVGVETVNELNFYWTKQDYINLLEIIGIDEADTTPLQELKELLFMGLTDLEPEEAAEIVLTYKLENKLNSGQIQNLSHEMMEDKVAEEYSDPAMHFDLFNINQLLYKAFNGTFPNTIASIIEIKLQPYNIVSDENTIEYLLKAIYTGLKDNNLIKRLFDDQLTGKEPFTDAKKVIWHYNKKEEGIYIVTTSSYWLNMDDFQSIDFNSEIRYFED